VGAIAILFLFVVMMINIKSEEMNRTRYTPIGVIIIMVLIMEVYMVYPKLSETSKNREYMINGGTSNIRALGEMMYS
jgi:NADH-quinone oxidoreductase subunit J